MLLETDDRSLRIRVFNAIENAILDGEYKDGDSLNELRLSKELGISRTPVREALMQLELEGLVRSVPNKGAVVVGVTEKDIHDIYEIRIRIEGLAAWRKRPGAVMAGQIAYFAALTITAATLLATGVPGWVIAIGAIYVAPVAATATVYATLQMDLGRRSPAVTANQG